MSFSPNDPPPAGDVTWGRPIGGDGDGESWVRLRSNQRYSYNGILIADC